MTAAPEAAPRAVADPVSAADPITVPELTIGGRRSAGRDQLAVIDPSTGEVFATAPAVDVEQLDEAFAAARTAFRSWRATDRQTRRELLRACAAIVTEHAEELAVLLSREQGKTLTEARGEPRTVARWFTAYADLDVPAEVVRADADHVVEVIRRPLGVVAAITPWNVPLGMASWKLAPALLAGNTVVLKPSPYTPLSTLRLGELLNEVLPPGVVNVVAGGDAIGAAMTAHPDAAKVTFTGSVAGGRKVAAAAGAGLKRVTVEAGGNDAAIVLPDARPDEIAEKLFWSSMVNNGQICIAVKRVYAPPGLREELVDRFADLARAVVVGPGDEPGVRLGAMANEMQLGIVTSMVDEARAAGARVVAGGERLPRPGYFYPPTVVTDLPPGTRLELEEQFGPVLPVLEYTDLDEVIDRINDGPHGLGGSVWGADPQRAAEVAARLDVGTAWVNKHLGVSPDVPFGGHRHSGVGAENGLAGYHEFTSAQILHRPVAGSS